jgi:hypothetical protein
MDFRGGAPGEAFVIGQTPGKTITFSRTENAGSTWSPAIEFQAAEQFVTLLAVAGKHVVVGDPFGQHTFRVSHDGGRNFTRVEGNVDNYYTHLSVKPDGTIWTFRATDPPVVARSTDDGKTFVPVTFPFPNYIMDGNRRSAAFGADLLITQGYPNGSSLRLLVMPFGSTPFTLPPKSSIGPIIGADETNTSFVIPRDSPPYKVFWRSPNDADFTEGPSIPVLAGEASVASLSDSAIAIAYVAQDGLYFSVVLRQ